MKSGGDRSVRGVVENKLIRSVVGQEFRAPTGVPVTYVKHEVLVRSHETFRVNNDRSASPLAPFFVSALFRGGSTFRNNDFLNEPLRSGKSDRSGCQRSGCQKGSDAQRTVITVFLRGHDSPFRSGPRCNAQRTVITVFLAASAVAAKALIDVVGRTATGAAALFSLVPADVITNPTGVQRDETVY